MPNGVKPKYTEPKLSVFHGAGGGANGVYPIEVLRFLRRETGYEPYELYDFFFAESVSAITAAALTAKNPREPKRPLMTIEEYADTFYRNVARFIPFDPEHYDKQTLRHFHRYVDGLKRLFVRRASRSRFKDFDENGPPFVDRTVMEESLKDAFGDLMLEDTLRGICLTSQRIHSARERPEGEPDRIRPYRFIHIPEHMLADGAALAPLSPSTPVPLWKAVLAGTAFPTIFKSFTVEETGDTHIDAAIYANPCPLLIRFPGSMRRGQNLIYTFFGTGCLNQAIPPETFNQLDWIDLNKMRFINGEMGRVQVIMDNVSTIQGLFGQDNTHIIQPYMGRNAPDLGVPLPPTDAFDTRPLSMQARRAYARAFIEANRENLLRYAEKLVQNQIVSKRMDVLAAFSNSAGRSNWFSLRRLFQTPATAEGLFDDLPQVPETPETVPLPETLNPHIDFYKSINGLRVVPDKPQTLKPPASPLPQEPHTPFESGGTPPPAPL